MKYLFYCYTLFSITWLGAALDFNKVVIWGHKLHSHTHSYIHYSFYRAFQHLGYETYWFDDKDSLNKINLEKALFITEGQVDKNIPVRDDCYYILHNCDGKKYRSIMDSGRGLILQVFTYDCLPRNVQQIEPYIFMDYGDRCLYMPWATDLLPHEIDDVKTKLPDRELSTTINWVGTMAGGVFGNIDELTPFIKAAESKGIKFKHDNHLSAEDNKQRIFESYCAPAIVGEWQEKNGYIPCRAFKNISYGQYCVTNSKAVHEILGGRAVYNSDTKQLFYDAHKKLAQLSTGELIEAMDFVRDHHTYLNRIDVLLNALEEVRRQWLIRGQ